MRVCILYLYSYLLCTIFPAALGQLMREAGQGLAAVPPVHHVHRETAWCFHSVLLSLLILGKGIESGREMMAVRVRSTNSARS
jgi:hypothetical protein